MMRPAESSPSSATLRVAVLTRTGRLSGARLAQAVAQSRHTLCGVMAERRTSLVARVLRRHSGQRLRTLFGVEFWRDRIGSSATRTPAPPARRVAQDALAAYAEPGSLNDASSVSTLSGWAADVLVVANAPILQPAVFQSCRIMAINFHTGRLPEFGGVESEFWALYEAQTEAWVTLHKISSKLDSGEILAEQPVPVAAGDTAQSLHAKCIEYGRRMLPELLDRLADGDRPPLRTPGPANLRPWPTNAQRRELRRRRTT